MSSWIGDQWVQMRGATAKQDGATGSYIEGRLGPFPLDREATLKLTVVAHGPDRHGEEDVFEEAQGEDEAAEEGEAEEAAKKKKRLVCPNASGVHPNFLALIFGRRP